MADLASACLQVKDLVEMALSPEAAGTEDHRVRLMLGEVRK